MFLCRCWACRSRRRDCRRGGRGRGCHFAAGECAVAERVDGVVDDAKGFAAEPVRHSHHVFVMQRNLEFAAAHFLSRVLVEHTFQEL